MASDKQIAANRMNAAKSTGPRTDIGKLQSRRNALKHGLTAADVLLANEDPAEFRRLHEGLVEQYNPQHELARSMVATLCASLWRLRRIPAFEAAIFQERDGLPTKERLRHRQMTRTTNPHPKEIMLSNVDYIRRKALEPLSRYETHLFKQIKMLMEHLEATCVRQPSARPALVHPAPSPYTSLTIEASKIVEGAPNSGDDEARGVEPKAH